MTHKADRIVDINVSLHGANGSLESEYIPYGSAAEAKIFGTRHDEEVFEQLAVPDELLAGLETGDPMEPFVKKAAGPRLFVEAILRIGRSRQASTMATRSRRCSMPRSNQTAVGAGFLWTALIGRESRVVSGPCRRFTRASNIQK